MKLFGKEINFTKSQKSTVSPYYARPQKVENQPVKNPEITLPPNPTPTPSPETVIVEKKEIKTKKYKVAGVSYREEEIISLGFENHNYELSKKEIIENYLYNERIYEYEFFPSNVELIPEPTNPHDSNAIKVIVDGVHVGYIKSGSCSHVHKLLKENRIDKIYCEIGGGNYKYLEYDEYEDICELDKSESGIFVHLEIQEK